MITCAECETEFERPSIHGIAPTYCRPCGKARKLRARNAWDKAHPEVKRIRRGWTPQPVTHPLCETCGAVFKREHLLGNVPKWCTTCKAEHEREREHAKLLARRCREHGITIRRYRELLAEQDNRCAICRRDWGRKGPQVDHCHTTGAVRGLLCTNCNPGLGWFRDDPELLMAAARYLQAA